MLVLLEVVVVAIVLVVDVVDVLFAVIVLVLLSVLISIGEVDNIVFSKIKLGDEGLEKLVGLLGMANDSDAFCSAVINIRTRGRDSGFRVYGCGDFTVVASILASFTGLLVSFEVGFIVFCCPLLIVYND
jgi:hypothetical protein